MCGSAFLQTQFKKGISKYIVYGNCSPDRFQDLTSSNLKTFKKKKRIKKEDVYAKQMGENQNHEFS